MKILKIFGIVVGIHLFALILIFANPGCSSTTKPPPSPGDTSSTSTASPIVAAPSGAATTDAPAESAPSSSAITFNPDTPAAAAPATTDTGVRFTPTRPGTPVAGALLAEPVADVTPATSYTVKSGDNLWTIARKNGITVAQLTSANRLSANATLRPGQKLIIPGRTASGAGAPAAAAKVTDPFLAPASSTASPDAVKHVVKSGETLGGIARRYGVRQGELAVANNISDPARIRPGMELVIPGWKAPATKSASEVNGAEPPAAANPLLSQPAPSAPPPVPVIQVDDAPAPKQP
jgi:LysM repeat protein